MKVCPDCKADNTDDAGYCENCGVDLSSPGTVTSKLVQNGYPVDDAVPEPQENIPPHPPALMKAGSLLFVVGVVGALIDMKIPPQLDAYGLDSGNGLLHLIIGSNLSTFLALAGLTSGILTLLRRGFYVSVVLGIVSCFAIGPVFITTIGSIIGTITVALNRREFIPIIHGPPDKERPCPLCRHPLHWVNGYREWYCFNCKNYRKLPRDLLQRPLPRPAVAAGDDTEDEDDST